MTYTAEQIEAIGGNRWTGSNGITRVYLNDWPALIGLDVEYYKSGNVWHATLDGQRLSNRKAGQLLYAKVWWQDGTIHVTTPSVLAEQHLDRLHAGIAAAVANA